MERINVRVHLVAGEVDHASTNDKVAMGVGLVLFWPALLMLKGNGPEHEELSRLKGEYDAVNEAMIRHNCNSETASAAPSAAVTAPSTVAMSASSPASGNQSAASNYSQWTAKQKQAKAHATATISGAVN